MINGYYRMPEATAAAIDAEGFAAPTGFFADSFHLTPSGKIRNVEVEGFFV